MNGAETMSIVMIVQAEDSFPPYGEQANRTIQHAGIVGKAMSR